MGKSTISIAISNSFLYVYQRVELDVRFDGQKWWIKPQEWEWLGGI